MIFFPPAQASSSIPLLRFPGEVTIHFRFESRFFNRKRRISGIESLLVEK